MGCLISTQTSPSFWGQISRAFFLVDSGGSLIVCDGGDCRCEVSFQSYSPSNVELGLQNANFWGFLGDFSVRGRDLLTFGGALLHYIQTGYYVKA